MTSRVRRVAEFDPGVVRAAIVANTPTHIVLNHVDYVDARCRGGFLTDQAEAFIRNLEQAIERHVNLVGTGPDETVEAPVFA